MPKVLRILNRLIIGGPSKNAVYLSRYMQPEFETKLVIGGREDHEQDADYLATSLGIETVCIPEMKRAISMGDDYAAYRKLKKIIREFRPDIVHTHAAKSGALGRMAARACRVPVIVHTFHGHVFHSYFSSLKTNFFIRTERFLAGMSDAIVAISDVQKTELSSVFRIAKPEKFHVIPLGLDLDAFTIDQETKRRMFREEFGVSDDTVAIGIIGRLVPIKNHSLFLHGIKRLLNNGEGNFRAFIIGDGESRQSIESEADALQIGFTTERDDTHNKPLIFTSWRKDVDVICAGLDIVALSSLNEGTPVSLIEAQAAGKPIVSTRVGGISDVVLENRTALLSDVQDRNGFAENLIRLVSNKPLRDQFSYEGREFVMKKFSYRRLVDDMCLLYNNLLSKKKR